MSDSKTRELLIFRSPPEFLVSVVPTYNRRVRGVVDYFITRIYLSAVLKNDYEYRYSRDFLL